MYSQGQDSKRYISRDEVPNYIVYRYGSAASITAKTLAKLAVTGGGPEYVKFGRRVAYSPEKIDQWVNSRAQAMSSTSSPVVEG